MTDADIAEVLEQAWAKVETIAYLQSIGYTIIEDAKGFVAVKYD